MKSFCSAVCFLLITLMAQGDEKARPRPNPAKQLAALQKAHEQAEAAFYKAAQALPDTPAGQKKYKELWKAYDKGQAERFMGALAVARAEPKSAVGFAALEWILTIPRSYYLPAGKPALELSAEHHATNPKVGKIIAWLAYFGPHESFDAHAAAFTLIEAVAKKNPDRTARGQAVMALALQAKQKFAVAEYKKSPDLDKRAAAAEKAFEVLLKDYGDCPRLSRSNAGTLGQEARRQLFELRHLRVGKAAPDIAGDDLDGVKFKLSDYRGKVVVLQFWGDW
jgi:hypothetical protein